MIKSKIILLVFLSLCVNSAVSQSQSIARYWYDTFLSAIPYDASRPTIHARNMYHMGLVMHDAWAAFDKEKPSLMLGKTYQGFTCPCELESFEEISRDSLDAARAEAISYAAFRLIFSRFNEYGTKNSFLEGVVDRFNELGYKQYFYATEYTSGSPAALGNYIASCMIEFGLTDGSNQDDRHENLLYQPLNPPLNLAIPGNATLPHPNHWQPLDLRQYLDAKGRDKSLPNWQWNQLSVEDIFLSADWGHVKPFALTDHEKEELTGQEGTYPVYLDPGAPPYFNPDPKDSLQTQDFMWNFLAVLSWSTHLDPADSVKIDISPGAWGHTASLPREFSQFKDFYDLEKGGTSHTGHPINPYTKQPYSPNWVYRGDYTRVIAEYWVDGVLTVSPPGHWIQTLNYITDHELTTKKWKGKGKEMDLLEWEIKSYLLMSGAMHDAAIAAWSVKTYYDYIRPISVIRWLAGRGQSSHSELPNYHAYGLPLIPGMIELIGEKDPLVGPQKEHLNKIKLYSWRGHEAFDDPTTETAGVGWVRGETWWPYQRYSASTPPFAGYVSGHSTFSAAGAQVMTLLTGDPFFPGGLAEFKAGKHEFLQFEVGPSEEVILQWATYQDAADECSLSRIWGGIHPPSDDVPGRIMGTEIGQKAFDFLDGFWR